jgi:hypothetical protein
MCWIRCSDRGCSSTPRPLSRARTATGWFIDNRGAEYDHDGDINGFVSYNAIFPAKRAEIIVLSNIESTDVRTITEHLAGLIGVHAA